MSTTRDDMNTP